MKKFFVSFVASLSLATGLFAQVQSGDVDTVHIVPGRTSAPIITNTVTVTNYVYVQQAYTPTRPPMSVAQTPAPAQYAPPQPEQYVAQQPPVYVEQRPYYPGVVVTPAGRPVERMGDWVPYGGYSYNNSRRSYGYSGQSRMEIRRAQTGPVETRYIGQTSSFSGTISVPGGYRGGGGVIVGGGGSLAAARAASRQSAPAWVYRYTSSQHY